jgi:hypothetical protein
MTTRIGESLGAVNGAGPRSPRNASRSFQTRNCALPANRRRTAVRTRRIPSTVRGVGRSCSCVSASPPASRTMSCSAPRVGASPARIDCRSPSGQRCANWGGTNRGRPNTQPQIDEQGTAELTSSECCCWLVHTSQCGCLLVCASDFCGCVMANLRLLTHQSSVLGTELCISEASPATIRVSQSLPRFLRTWAYHLEEQEKLS